MNDDRNIIPIPLADQEKAREIARQFRALRQRQTELRLARLRRETANDNRRQS